MQPGTRNPLMSSPRRGGCCSVAGESGSCPGLGEAAGDDPAFHRELRAVAGRVQGLLAGRTVLEPLSGDGWWTAHLSQAARHVTALETNPDALRTAAGRRHPPGRVRVIRASPDSLVHLPESFDGAFCPFLRMAEDSSNERRLLPLLHDRLGPGGKIVLVDTRKARDMASPQAQSALRERVRALAPDARSVRLDVGERLWCLSYTL